ncbi:MAG TPA: hypothetical protein VLE70_17410 [Anaerolineae bacterium]|nr:hypothetical protein [Anaerolineae bacterium]
MYPPLGIRTHFPRPGPGLMPPHGPPAKIITRRLTGDFTLLYTEATLKELKDVLNRA